MKDINFCAYTISIGTLETSLTLDYVGGKDNNLTEDFELSEVVQNLLTVYNEGTIFYTKEEYNDELEPFNKTMYWNNNDGYEYLCDCKTEEEVDGEYTRHSQKLGFVYPTKEVRLNRSIVTYIGPDDSRINCLEVDFRGNWSNNCDKVLSIVYKYFKSW